MDVVLFIGAGRSFVREMLEMVIERQFRIVGCVFDEPKPNESDERAVCVRQGIPCYTTAAFYDALEAGSFPRFDFGISYRYLKIIKTSAIEFARGNIINFHPAPVSVHKGVAPSCYCLLNGYREWAVTAHYVAPEIDEGDIIMERSFPIEGIRTCVESERRIQEQSLLLCGDVLSLIASGRDIPRKKQKLPSGRYCSMKWLEQEKKILMSDSHEIIDKKILALWLPPYHGACVEIDGKRYSLVNEELLQEIAALYQTVGKHTSEQTLSYTWGGYESIVKLTPSPVCTALAA